MAAATEDTAAILEKPTAEDLGASSSSSAPQTYNHPGSAGAVEIDHVRRFSLIAIMQP